MRRIEIENLDELLKLKIEKGGLWANYSLYNLVTIMENSVLDAMGCCRSWDAEIRQNNIRCILMSAFNGSYSCFVNESVYIEVLQNVVWNDIYKDCHNSFDIKINDLYVDYASVLHYFIIRQLKSCNEWNNKTGWESKKRHSEFYGTNNPNEAKRMLNEMFGRG